MQLVRSMSGRSLAIESGEGILVGDPWFKVIHQQVVASGPVGRLAAVRVRFAAGG